MLAVYVVLVVAGAYMATQLKFDHKRERFFPADDEDLAFTAYYFNQIEKDDIFILTGLEFGQSVLNSGNLQLIDSVVTQIKSLDLVEDALAITNYKTLKKAGPTYYMAPLLSAENKTYRQRDSVAMAQNPYVLHNLVSSDFKCANILVKTKVIDTQQEADEIYHGLRRILESHGGLHFHLAGFPVMQSVTVSQLQFEMQFYVTLSGCLLIIILLVVYRSLRGLLVPVVSLIGGMALFFGYLALTGQTLDLMSSLFPILMLIFVMADVVHLQTHYLDELNRGKNPIEAMRLTMKEIGMALFLTSFTTAVGFGTLSTSRIDAIRYFGLNAAAGVAIAFAVVMLFSSSLLLFFTKNKSQTNNDVNNWSGFLEGLYRFNKTNFKLISATVLVVIALSLWGISRISTNAFIKGDIPKDAQLKGDFDFFEQKFGGVRTFEMAAIPAEGHSITDPEVLLEMAKFEKYIADSQGINNVNSPTTPYRLLQHSYHRGRRAYDLPSDVLTLKKYNLLLKQVPAQNLKNLMNEDKSLGRISGRQADSGSTYHEKQMKTIARWVADNMDEQVLELKPAGTTLMYDKNHEYLRKSLFKSLGLAFLIVGLLFALLFKDYRMLLVSIIPNVIPMLIAAAAMGFLDIKLQAITSIFFAISFGIAVDDTIHFLTRYKLERRKGKTVDKAIRQTMLISGKAIIITSIILVVSFISLTFSNFNGTYYIGVLVSITLASALFADIFVLPQLLYLINRKRKDK